MITKHGYYIAATNRMHGDEELALEAKDLFLVLGFTLDKRKNYQGSRFDGISIFIREDGELVKRLCLQDFFTTNFRCLCFDMPIG